MVEKKVTRNEKKKTLGGVASSHWSLLALVHVVVVVRDEELVM